MNPIGRWVTRLSRRSGCRQEVSAIAAMKKRARQQVSSWKRDVPPSLDKRPVRKRCGQNRANSDERVRALAFFSLTHHNRWQYMSCNIPRDSLITGRPRPGREASNGRKEARSQSCKEGRQEGGAQGRTSPSQAPREEGVSPSLAKNCEATIRRTRVRF